ncbi:MAG: biotin/lipoyl-containing protein [Clostridiales bacterium]|nr:biotin/lipoyl-containing protein [Clostridiales bacterium]
MSVEVLLPKLGVTMTEARIIRWLKEEGDDVSEGEALCEIETDKSTLEVESPASGHLKEILIKEQEDEAVPINTVIAVIEA